MGEGMNKESMTMFTRKIANSNGCGLIVVLFEIYFAYEKDALQALELDDEKEYLHALRQCSQVMRHLKDSLDFSYEISYQLYPLYQFVEETLAKAMYRKKKADIENASKVVKPLWESFEEIAKVDTSAPLMKNTQEVTVGLTYSKNNLNEAYTKEESSRGFWA